LQNLRYDPDEQDIAIHQDEFKMAAEDVRMTDDTKNEAFYAKKFIQSLPILWLDAHPIQDDGIHTLQEAFEWAIEANSNGKINKAT